MLFAFFSCSESSTDQSLSELMQEEQEYSDRLDEVKNLFYMIPSPIETAIQLRKAGAEYDYKLLNAPNNAKNYDSRKKKAINLGVYSADLSYATLFDQIQDIRFYISSSKSLAEDLGIMKAFNQEMIDRVEYNLEDKDSMMNIVSEIYWLADAHLKETDNVAVSSLVLYGGWVEAFYLACNLYKADSTNVELKKRITEQRFSLDNLMGLMQKTAEVDQGLKQNIEELEKLNKAFDALTYTEEEPTIEQEGEVAVIKGATQTDMSNQEFEEIFALVTEIRANNIQ